MRWIGRSAFAFSMGCAVAAAAQPVPGPEPSPQAHPVEARFRLNAAYFDNFFQAAEGLPEENVLAGGLEAHVIGRLRRESPLQAYAYGDYTRYRGFDPSTGVAVGVRSDDRPASFEVAVQYHNGRPSREVGDVIGRADDLGAAAELSYRVLGDLQLSALGGFRREWYDLAPQKRNDVFDVGAAARYRGWTEFSPEVGFRWGRRDVVSDNEDLEQREWFVRFRWTPTPAFYLSARYRRRMRDYTGDDPARSNFNREDRRQQYTAGAELRLGRHWSWGAYYAREDSDSTRGSGVFTTQMATVGLTLIY
jgi:hypothetical protein